MVSFRYLAFLVWFSVFLQAAEPQPDTLAAFDRYVKVTEDDFTHHQGPEDFLWLDHHPKEKSLVWLRQSVLVPLQTLDNGNPIEVPNGVIQHWLGAVYAEGMDVAYVRGMMLNFRLYKDFFKQQIIDSKLIKQDGDQYEVLLRLYRKHLSTVVLNVNETAKYTVLDPARWTLTLHSTHIGEAEHPKDQKDLDEERSPEKTEGHLWRLNMYFRVHQADNGVYIEFEIVSLAREEGRKIVPTRVNGFQDFPHELAQGMLTAFETVLPRPKRG